MGHPKKPGDIVIGGVASRSLRTRAFGPIPRVLVGLAVACGGFSLLSGGPSAVAQQGFSASVTGYLIVFPAKIGSVKKNRDFGSGIFVPGVTVRLRNLDTETVAGEVETDLSGRFQFRAQPAGSYDACWSAPGFVSECREFEILDSEVNLAPAPMTLARSKRHVTIYGKVRFADGTVPRTMEPFAGINAFATVHGPRANREVYVNNQGEYVMPAVNRGSQLEVTATIEDATRSRSVSMSGSQWPAGSTRRVDLKFGNAPPNLFALLATTPGPLHWTARAGDTISIEAFTEDPDNDALEYRWILPDASAELPPASSRTLTYTLSDIPGISEFTALVGDGHGGYDREKIVIRTTGISFSGRVRAGRSPARRALVDINGQQTTTDERGFFRISVKENNRYVMNIRQEGYGLVSKVFDNGVLGGEWTLPPATIRTIDPTRTTRINTTRATRACTKRKGDEPSDKTRKCAGLGITIPANSLVDENGDPPPGMVEVAVTTVDLRAPDGMPGDYTALTREGERGVMRSFGAGTVEITAGGREYDLEEGAAATVRIPIDPEAQVDRRPSAVPLLSYDEGRGVWVTEGRLKLSSDESTYVGEVEHFSAINADVIDLSLTGTVPACVRVETPVMTSPFKLTMTAPVPNSTNLKVVTETIDNGARRLHVIYNLPPGITIYLQAFEMTGMPPARIPLRGETTVVLQGVNEQVVEVTTGGSQAPATPFLPDFPYLACQSSVELIPEDLPDDTQDQFLHGFSFEASNISELTSTTSISPGAVKAAAQKYYDTVDPQGLREDLDEFKAVNGFPASETTVAYANSADLGFGREMHCTDSTGDYACYVTNYGDRFTDDATDYALAKLPDQTQAVATVAMEYSPIQPGGSPVVKFYVYSATEPSTATPTPGIGNGRVASADLDGYGQRPVPMLCMVCHGGEIPPDALGSPGAPAWNPMNPSTADLGANFLPFDLSGFTIPAGDKPAAQGPFHTLNLDVRNKTDPSAAIRDVIDAMYPLNTTPQVEGFLVPGWDGSSVSPAAKSLYKEVVGPSCRTCHVAQGTDTVPTDAEWDEASIFLFSGTTGLHAGTPPLIASYVCNAHVMPHAIVTHNRFWLSSNPHQPKKLADVMDSDSNATAADVAGCLP